MNVIAIMNHMGVYFKEEPIRELHRALERRTSVLSTRTTVTTY